MTVDVVLPAGWDMPRFKVEAYQALRERLDEPFIVRLDVDEAEVS